MASLNEYGSWDEESMSNDLGKKTGFFENMIEPYHNSESAGATEFNITLPKFKTKMSKEPEYYLKCVDNGEGMNIQQTNDFSKINKDIYNKRTNLVKTKSKNTHSFGGKGAKDFMAAVYSGITVIGTSSPGTSELILIKFNTTKSWGGTSENPKIFKINDIDNMTEEEYEKFNPLQLEYYEYNKETIKKIVQDSGFLIFGKLKKKFIRDLTTKQGQQDLKDKFQKHCNDNLKNCKINLNGSLLTYTPPRYDGKYTLSHTMSLWKGLNSPKYVLTCNYEGKEKCMRFTKGAKSLIDFNEKRYKKLASFERNDTFNYKYFQDKFYKKLFNIQKHKTDRSANLKSTINYNRHGTLLLSRHNRPKQNSGDMWIRDVLGLFNTVYQWNNNYYMDEILQINADKLSPNLTKTNEFLTQESNALLTNNSLNNLFIRDNKYTIFEVYRYYNDKKYSDESKYKFLKKKLPLLKKEMIDSSKLIEWLKSYETYQKVIRHKKLIEVVDLAADTATKSSRKSKEFIAEMEIYMDYPYFKRDNAIKRVMEIVEEIKQKSDKIIEWSQTPMKFYKKIQTPSFYYKINNKIDLSTNSWIFDDNLMFEGEIGYTTQSLMKRHPNSNIQYTAYINSDGSRISGGRGNKIFVEKKVIDALGKINGLEFGTKDNPKAKEKFKFPSDKFSEVFNKIIDNVKIYQEENDIFEER